MPGEGHVMLFVSRSEVGMIRDALDLMEDLEYLRPERQQEIAVFIDRLTEMVGLYDFAARELGR